jgi:hypothetical protein
MYPRHGACRGIGKAIKIPYNGDMDHEERVLEVMWALGDQSENGRVWAENLIRYADNAFLTFKPELFPYPVEVIRSAWRVANQIPDDNSGPAGIRSRLPRPNSPLEGSASEEPDNS